MNTPPRSARGTPVPPKEVAEQPAPVTCNNIVVPTVVNQYHPAPSKYPVLYLPLDPEDDQYKRIYFFIYFFIDKCPHEERPILEKIRDRFIQEMVDIKTIHEMTKEDSLYWGIPWGLGKRLKREAEHYVAVGL
jgi:hypothetical protein